MNVLVTGGAGYIGSHVVKLLGESNNYNITVIDNLSTGKEDAVLYGDFIQANLADNFLMENIFKEKQFDAVFHFAASIVVPESIENPLKYYLNNTVNTINLVNLCIKYNVSKFIFSSTAAVYGEPDGTTVKETSMTNPINPYGRSKLMSETIIQDTAAADKDFKYVILRYFNAAGSDIKGRIGHSFPDATHLIKVAAEAAVGKRDKVYIFGDDYDTPDGTGIRDYIHVDDLADAHIKALEYLEANDSQIFNCGYGQGYSVKQVIKTMQEISENEFKVEIIEKRPGDPACVIADNSKIIKKTGWKPMYNNLEIICRTAFEWERNSEILVQAQKIGNIVSESRNESLLKGL
ncbi:MAG: UDP-glucose 4-epimerase GalE [Candidatus Gastranaerophilales bacterium]|nr:UDP-glucose 4-epimerase GalE [Candidatus Gastranaerophilales bacterium]